LPALPVILRLDLTRRRWLLESLAAATSSHESQDTCL